MDDCIAVGQKLADGDERVVLFVKPLQGDKLSPELVKRIQEAIRDRLSRRHVPAKILFCDDIPVRLSFKPHRKLIPELMMFCSTLSMASGLKLL